MGDQHEQPPTHSPRQMIIAGLIVSIVMGFLARPSLSTVLAANQCGAFGDACDDHGTTSITFFVMLALTILAIVAFIVGLVLMVEGFRRRN